ncbi:hypothetical protein P8C59_003545 [Phyllachora maydis]|uniref:Uncharacterized protein n=1 Tax=Phyllachora maydis TaxID=1825666 RepID=A0AAD9I0L5_9PEZI|nr:hypothetical protein P8C59_003545 [Phyllachora maydis]
MLLTRVDISFTYLNSTKDYSICFSYNGNTVADLGPKLSNSSNITTKLSRDFYSKEGPRPLTTTSTTIVDSRNGKGSSRTSIINSSLVPIGFSDSDFAGDKATSKSTYGYLYKPIDYPITLYRDNQGSITVANDPALYTKTKYTLLKFRASNPADLGQSSRPLLPIRTLLEDKEDGEDYSEVIEVLEQYIKSYKRVIASQSSNIKILLLSLNTLKASIEDSVSAIKNISSTLASLTNSSNVAATGKTSYTIDNTATSNLDPPIDIGSKEGFKDTITSSIVKELSKKAYTIPDNKNPDISNTYSNSDQAILLMLLRNSLSSSPRATILWIYIPSKAFKLLVRQYSRPIESEKKDVYNEFYALTFSTYKKGLLGFNAEFNGYLAKLTIAKIDIDPSLILNLLVGFRRS